MFSWIYSKEFPQVNFEFVQKAMTHTEEYYFVNTLPYSLQTCLINNTLNASEEEPVINDMLQNYNIPDKKMVVYGKNYLDTTIHKKAQQLSQLGLRDIYIYSGGMFEWLLLQDIYGNQEFPTTSKQLDILLYKPTVSNGIF